MRAWEPVAGPPGLRVDALGCAADGTLLAASVDGVFASTDRAATWTEHAPTDPIARVGPALWTGRAPATPPPPCEPRGEPVAITALAADGDRIWIGRRVTWMSSYPTPGEHGPILHMASRVTETVHASSDGGATWRGFDGIAARGFGFDPRGRVWVATTTGVDVVDGDQPWRRVLDAAASAIAIDRAGRVVVGTSGGGAHVAVDGERFTALPARFVERGAWGSLEGNASGFRTLRRGPDGAVWAATDGGVLALAEPGTRWRSINYGLTVRPRVSSRSGTATPTALAFTPDGTAFVATTNHGLFRRAPDEPDEGVEPTELTDPAPAAARSRRRPRKRR